MIDGVVTCDASDVRMNLEVEGDRPKFLGTAYGYIQAFGSGLEGDLAIRGGVHQVQHRATGVVAKAIKAV